MKIEVNECGGIVLKEVFNGILLTTAEGNSIGICMRDDTFEINVIPKTRTSRLSRVNMKTGKVEIM